MKLRQKIKQGFTLIELLVVISIIAILASLAVPAITGAIIRGQMTQTVNNGHQIYLAAFQMGTDALTSGDPELGWPGELSQATTNPTTSVAAYVNRLIKYEYLKPSDVTKVCMASGITAWDINSQFDGQKNCAFKIYQDVGSDGASTIFLATQNFTYGQPLSKTQEPYKDKGFVIVRKGGDGAAYKPLQYQSKPTLGLLPKRTDFTDNPTESASDILSQS